MWNIPMGILKLQKSCYAAKKVSVFNKTNMSFKTGSIQASRSNPSGNKTHDEVTYVKSYV